MHDVSRKPAAITSGCRRSVKHPTGPFCTRVLWGFAPFPCVFAADSTVSDVPTENLGPLPRYIGKPELPEHGWERIKELFDRDEMQTYSEEVTNIVKSAVMAAAVGMMYGGLPAARAARERFIQQSQAEVFRHRVEAVRSAHNAAIRGFIRYGWRWSWRVAAFVTLFNSMSTGLSVYRDKYVLSHYSAAGAITGGLFRVNLGLGGMLAGTAIGAVLGIPAGVLMMAMQKAAGETLRERKRREQREMYELKLAEWSARLHVTEGLIGEMDSKIEENSTESDLETIEELLNLPRNQELPGDSGKK
ncbi:complex I assembly factor TIMMDC1, mitochondrial [Acipenser oxyrinchus oxyrinchus]|uniref:Complex I assembly factor TIMMDC1, mitochondrial n=1 Tax=Acipenser oxyrinchus oxyrinchus TaxID=40147 RepID=A0AAD8DF45_ACIOX|nr:complex I assembly factor TIMMDC1, mitochondrial [Acipenser oxyrinchus oxyrinchus]